MNVSLFLDSTIAASHRLPHVPDDHPCHARHGHTFKVRLWAEGEVTTDPSSRHCGMLCDYADIAATWKPVHAQLDHHDLNDIIDNPTCENIARWILLNTPTWISSVQVSVDPAGVHLQRSDL